MQWLEHTITGIHYYSVERFGQFVVTYLLSVGMGELAICVFNSLFIIIKCKMQFEVINEMILCHRFSCISFCQLIFISAMLSLLLFETARMGGRVL